MTRKHLLCGVAAIAIAAAVSGPVAAADIVPPYAKAVPYAPTWAGGYVGIHAGYGWSKWKHTCSQDSTKTCTSSGSLGQALLTNFNSSGGDHIGGAVLGMHGGYNFQWNILVAGVEADLTLTPGWQACAGNEAGLLGGGGAPSGMCSNTTVAHARIDWLSSVRGRVGIAFDRALVYATGGVAWVKRHIVVGSESSGANYQGIVAGWVAGAGIEYKVSQFASIRGEFLHYGFHEDLRFGTPSGPQNWGHGGLDSITVVRVGASFHFN
jgi:outer membrane immunogenic protein